MGREVGAALERFSIVVSALVLVFNGTNLGQFVAAFVDAGRGTELFGLLVPHGAIEPSAVVVAGPPACGSGGRSSIPVTACGPWRWPRRGGGRWPWSWARR